MQQDRELRDLVRAITAFRKCGDLRYPAKLRARITSWVAMQRKHGEWWTDISAALGMPVQTLMRWSEMRGVVATDMKAVDVIDAPQIGTVTLVAPTGLRIEGVSIDAAIAILRGIS